MTPKLYYVDLGGRAEAARVMMSIGDIKFEDIRMTRDEVQIKKEVFPFKQIPVFENDEGMMLTQTNAILLYVSKLAGAEPKNIWEQAKVVEILMANEDFIQHLHRCFWLPQGEERTELMESMQDTIVPTFYRGLETILSTSSTAKNFSVGTSITASDIVISVIMSWLQGGKIEGLPTNIVESYIKCNAIQEQVFSNSKVIAYYRTVKADEIPSKLTHLSG